MSKKNKDKRKEKLLTKEVNILEVNKSCFKDCFYSSSHEHVFTLSFLYFLHPHKVPPTPSNPAIQHRFRWALLEFRLFSFSEFWFSFRPFFFFGFESPAPFHSHTPHSLFLFNFTPLLLLFCFSLVFFSTYLSLCVANGPFRSTVGAWPVRWKLTSFRRGRGEKKNTT